MVDKKINKNKLLVGHHFPVPQAGSKTNKPTGYQVLKNGLPAITPHRKRGKTWYRGSGNVARPSEMRSQERKHYTLRGEDKNSAYITPPLFQEFERSLISRVRMRLHARTSFVLINPLAHHTLFN